MISPLHAGGVRVGGLCWVGQGPVVPAAGGRSSNLDISRARAYCVCSRCELGFGYFLLSTISSLFLFFPRPWD